MPVLQEIHTEFRRAYSYTNPYLVKNLDIWRLTNIPPNVPSDFYGIFAKLPMTADNDIEAKTADIGFNIVKLPFAFDVTPSTTKGWLHPEWTLARSLMYRNRALVLDSLPTLTATLPIVAYTNTKGVALTFNISALPQAEVYNKRRMGVTVKNPYNRTSNVNITATPPIHTTNEANSVDLSFDITLLSDA